MAARSARTGVQKILLSPFRLGRMNLHNRVVVAPMTRISASDNAPATARMAAYYRTFAGGGFGLVITEGIYTDRAYAEGYPNQPGLTDHKPPIGRAFIRANNEFSANMVRRFSGASTMLGGTITSTAPDNEGQRSYATR